MHCRADGGGQELDREESPGVKTKSSHAANDMAYYIREGRWEGRACGNWVEVMAVGGGRRRRRSNSRCSVAATDTGSPVYDRRSAGAETTFIICVSLSLCLCVVCARIVWYDVITMWTF